MRHNTKDDKQRKIHQKRSLFNKNPIKKVDATIKDR